MPKRRVAKSKSASAKSAPKAPRKAKAAAEEPEVSNDELTFEEPRANAPMQVVEVQCPYCGERLDVRVDPSEEGQVLIQDCSVCCKPVEMAVEVDDGEISVSASRG